MDSETASQKSKATKNIFDTYEVWHVHNYIYESHIKSLKMRAMTKSIPLVLGPLMLAAWDGQHNLPPQRKEKAWLRCVLVTLGSDNYSRPASRTGLNRGERHRS